MPSFTSLTAFAFLAFTAMASALPHGVGPSIPGSDIVDVKVLRDLPNLPGASSLLHHSKRADADDVSNLVHNVLGGKGVGQHRRQDDDDEDIDDMVTRSEPAPAVGALDPKLLAPLAGGALGHGALKSRGETRTLPVIILELTAKVQPVCDRIRHIVSLNLDAAATLDLAIPVLDELKITVLGVKAEIEFLVAHPIEGVLVLKGKVLSIRVFAELVTTVLITIVAALGLVAKIAATVKTEVVIGLVLEIGAALAVIVGGCLHLVAGLLVEITPLVECIAPIILELNLGALIQVLKLTVAAA